VPSSSGLKTGASCSSKMLVSTDKSTGCHSPDDQHKHDPNFLSVVKHAPENGINNWNATIKYVFICQTHPHKNCNF
jgi:hypothetical protein